MRLDIACYYRTICLRFLFSRYVFFIFGHFIRIHVFMLFGLHCNILFVVDIIVRRADGASFAQCRQNRDLFFEICHEMLVLVSSIHI